MVDRSHKSILDYLYNTGLTASYDALRSETNHDDFNPDPKSKHAGLLEKKWTSVIRLQKKVSNPSPLRISWVKGRRRSTDRERRAWDRSVVAGERGGREQKEEVAREDSEPEEGVLSKSEYAGRDPGRCTLSNPSWGVIREEGRLARLPPFLQPLELAFRVLAASKSSETSSPTWMDVLEAQSIGSYTSLGP